MVGGRGVGFFGLNCSSGIFMTPIFLTQTLALAEIPHLRRYAFCITGNRAIADIVVAAALEAISSNNERSAQATPSRLELYRKINRCIEAGGFRDKIAANLGNGFHAKLLGLPLYQRQIVTLCAVIALSHREVAAIMELAEDRVRQLYAEAMRALRQKPMRVLIIEDEPVVACELSLIVTRLGLSVAGLAKSKAEALFIANQAKPSLILADYQLAGETGLDAVRAIREKMDAGVIYVTAHPDVVVSLRDEASDIVIAKPFTVGSIERAVQTHIMAA
jgi:CheY-like chemotaxis protein